jgi:hypothetical protein
VQSSYPASPAKYEIECREKGYELGFDYCAFGMRLPLPFSNPKIVMLIAIRRHGSSVMSNQII